MIVLVLLVLALAALVVGIVRIAGWRFAVQRLGGALLVVVIVTFATSALLRQSSIDESQTGVLEELDLPATAGPCIVALGTGATPDAVRRCVDERGLDKNVFAQYGQWAGDLLTGDLGYADYQNREPLTNTLRQRMPRTAWLFLYSQLIALALAVPLGIWSAYQANKRGRALPHWLLPAAVAAMLAIAIGLGWGLAAVLVIAIAMPIVVYHFFKGGSSGDTTVNTLAFVLLSVPVFVLGESLRFVFAIEHRWYRLTGYASWSDGVGAHLKSVWLPALVLGLAAAPVYLRLLRADMIQNLQQDYVSVAKAKGMSDTHILFRHVLRPSTVTLLTVAGLNIAQLVNGAIVVEFIFDFDGMGSYVLGAVYGSEFFAIQTIVALVAILFVLANTVVDMLYTVVDPRVRAEVTS